MRSFTSNYGFFILSILLASLLIEETQSEDAFGDAIDWVRNLKEATDRAKSSNKPCMVLIHKSWCSACKNLAPKFANSTEILERSKDFVMCNLLDDAEPTDRAYHPDGSYIPRILFVSPEDKVLLECINKNGNANYKYFYSKPEDIAETMKQVQALYPKPLENQVEL